MICILARRGRFLETILKDAARSGVPRTRREPHRREVRTPTAGPNGLARTVAGGSGVPLPGAGFVGPHPKTATVERREGSRSYRDQGVAPRRRDRKKECACRRSITPHRGTELLLLRRPLAPKPPWARRRTRKRRHMRRRPQTRAQQRAAGTNNTALFDIVNRE